MNIGGGKDKQLHVPNDAKVGKGKWRDVRAVFGDLESLKRDTVVEGSASAPVIDDPFEKHPDAAVKHFQHDYHRPPRLRKIRRTRCAKCFKCCWKSSNRSETTGSILSFDQRVVFSSVLAGSDYKPKETIDKGVSVESGYFKQPERRFQNMSLANLRAISQAVVQKQAFLSHIKRPVAENKKKWKTAVNRTVIFNKQKAEDQYKASGAAFSSMNDILQMKIDNAINVQKRPVDGFNEALMEPTTQWPISWMLKNKKAQQVRMSMSRMSRLSMSRMSRMSTQSRGSRMSSQNSIPLKLTNLQAVRKSWAHWMDNDPRKLVFLNVKSFLEILPSLNKGFADELVGSLKENNKQFKFLENAQTSMETRRRKERVSTTERFLAVVYYDLKTVKPEEIFRRLVIKLIFTHYFIAFEERDINRADLRKEFMARQKYRKQALKLPTIFTNGLPIGGCSMLYFLFHKTKVDFFFKHSIMDPDVYKKWLRNPVENQTREPLTLKVPLSYFPLVHAVMSERIKSTNDNDWMSYMENFVMEGAFIVNLAQRSWNHTLQETKYEEPKLLRYVLLKMTIFRVLYVIEDRLMQCNLIDTSGNVVYSKPLQQAKCKVM